jgi:D-cysteine desulfhydrase family pyridoxal phosphate-dependent enzyme
MMPNYPKRYPFAHLPTPIEKLERLTELLRGPTLLIKRDDQTGLAGGGNKARKLEFLVAEAIAQGCDHLVTVGAPQSNHCRQTAAAAARAGLGCSLVFKGRQGEGLPGNLLLDGLLGAHLYWTEGEEPAAVMNRVVGQLVSMGRKPYAIPLGGSTVVGTAGYVLAMQELMGQLAAQNLNVDVIVHATGSGGTQAGMVLGAHIYGFRGTIFGVSVSRQADDMSMQVAALATATAAHLGLEPFGVVERVTVNDDYVGGGYGVVGETEREAIQLVAQKEGILLDPVYTGRAMGGLIDLIRWGAFTRQQTILFWHTGGLPALWAYAEQIK